MKKHELNALEKAQQDTRLTDEHLKMQIAKWSANVKGFIEFHFALSALGIERHLKVLNDLH